MTDAPWFFATLPQSDLRVAVAKKRIRSMRLRVRADGTIACSVPLGTGRRTAEDFVASHAAWIEQAVAKVAAERSAPRVLSAGSVAARAGLTLADCTDGYSAAWKRTAEETFMRTARRFLPCFAGRALPPFTLKGRAMRTLWGSCNRRTNTITLNWQLLAAPQPCIDYVVLHELTHFLYPHHDRTFYAFIARHLADYKACIRMLKTVRLQIFD